MKNKVVFLHGLGQDSTSWNEVESNLHSNIESIYIDFQKILKNKQITYQNLYEEICKILDNIETPFSICGLSLGGMLGLEYAIEHPENISNLILIGTQYKIPKILFSLQNLVFRVLPNKFFKKMHFSKKDILSITTSMKNIDFSKDLENLTARTLIIYGEKDNANKKASEGLAKSIPNSRLLILKNARHEVNLDTPKNLSDALCEYVSL
ncbi:MULTISPECIES: alpha/beta fold hydrolase [unclassified Enterococcus]|uniref:alpha/beta fold hydrolase n=1 Tax=unclassified Enterococcus TaxID=2608891 RepID=UPI001CE16E81|nr:MULTISPECIES: alpha/beta hydrolase [unclassified Enterococcus]MCA5014528.1 alpha/beta fold hydrolase [Enterococcus sp. S23]MCA5017781.1 alpha/beta fold hydrolase [Enterococcus sp. S22(2020)]